jgi:hypothetical protein
MQIVIGRNGTVRGIYSEQIDLAALGQARITRASHVEPDAEGRWLADLSPVGGPTFGPFDRRSEALEAEVYWLEENWLGAPQHGIVGENDRQHGIVGENDRSTRTRIDFPK